MAKVVCVLYDDPIEGIRLHAVAQARYAAGTRGSWRVGSRDVPFATNISSSTAADWRVPVPYFIQRRQCDARVAGSGPA